MGSSLRTRLAAINSAGKTKCDVSVRKTGLRFYTQIQPLPEGLEAPSETALQRMGLEGSWPGIEKALFLDTETTGLSGGAGTIVFMTGVAFVENGMLRLCQYTLGGYENEIEMLEHVARHMASHPLVVSFNGRAFDLPLLKSRFVMMRMNDRWTEPNQLDLLLPARRLWKKRLGTVRLSVLEEKVLRAGRTDDLPGSEAPRCFFSFLKTGDPTELERVEQHNRLDVLAMPNLLLQLLKDYESPASVREPEDLFSLGKTMERLGEREEAVRCYHMASLPRAVISVSALRKNRVAEEAMFALGLLYKRLGQYERAVQAFERSAVRGSKAFLAMIELEKYHEHRLRDYDTALIWANCAYATAKNEQESREALARIERLKRKIKRKNSV